MNSQKWGDLLYLEEVPVCTIRRILADADRIGEWGQEHLVYYHDYSRNDVMLRMYFPTAEEDPEHMIWMIVESGGFKKACALNHNAPEPDLPEDLGMKIPSWRAEVDLDTNEIDFDIPEMTRW